MQLPRQLEPVKKFAVQVQSDEVPDLAAGLAYRFLFAVFPFTIFLAALAAFVAQWIGIGDPTDEILSGLSDNLPPAVAEQIGPQLEAVLGQTRPALLSIGALTALWAANGGISSLITGMNKAYDVDEDRNFFVKTGTALALTTVASVGILVAFVTVVGGSILTEQAVETLGIPAGAWDVVSLLRFPVVLVFVAIAVAVLFRFGPNVRVSWRWTFLGGVVFAVGWLLATVLFGLYVANFSNYANTYGALGGVIVLMLWFYLTAFILLLAAEVTSMAAKAKEPEVIAAQRKPGKTASGAPVQPDGDPAVDSGMPGDDEAPKGGDSGPKPQGDDRRDDRGGDRRRDRREAPAPALAGEVMTRGEAARERRRAYGQPPMSAPAKVGALLVLGAAAVAGAIAGRLAGDDEDEGGAARG